MGKYSFRVKLIYFYNCRPGAFYSMLFTAEYLILKASEKEHYKRECVSRKSLVKLNILVSLSKIYRRKINGFFKLINFNLIKYG